MPDYAAKGSRMNLPTELCSYSRTQTLLFTDADTAFRTPLCSALRTCFSSVDEASGPADTLHLCALKHYDFVLLDGEIPSTLVLIREIRKIVPGQRILCTLRADPQGDAATKLFNAGLSGVLVKPYTPEHLFGAVAEEIRRVNSEQQYERSVATLQRRLTYQERLLDAAKRRERQLAEKMDTLSGRLREGEKQDIEPLQRIEALTGTAGRYALQNALNGEFPKAMIYLGIDGFDRIHADAGIGRGNRVLLETFNRVNRFLPRNAALFHITADVFVILLDDPEESQALLLAEQLQAFFAEAPLETGGQHYEIRFSIGIADGSGSALYAHAADAFREAREQGGFTIRRYRSDSTDENGSHVRFDQVEFVRRAIEEERLSAYFQAVISNRSSTTAHYEVLCRILDGDGRPLDIAPHLDAARAAGLGTQISRIIIDQAFKHFSGRSDRFSFRICRNDLEEEYLESFLEYKCDRYGILPERVCLELPRESSPELKPRLMRQIERLREAGFLIAVEGFGTEYSLLSRMLLLGANAVKIDTDLTRDLLENRFHRQVVERIVQFARDTGIKTIAEEVDSEALYTLIHDLGVDFSRGFYVGRPTPAIRSR
jgi:EAL domain-containing protein (putative c-di-GMP-specific phosphodiesterase class I)/GGDEF domain-containing protein